MKQIKILVTHGRAGWTRYANSTLSVTDDGPSTETTLPAFDAERAVADGRAEWVEKAEKAGNGKSRA